jgi:lysophospholipase L1-like esterase
MKRILIPILFLSASLGAATNIAVGPWKAWSGPADSLSVNAEVVRFGSAKDSLANAMLSGAFPEITLADGQQVHVGGVLSLAGVDASPAHQLRFGVFFKPAKDSPNGWLGYVSTSASPSNGGFILARTPTNKGGYTGAGGPNSGETRLILSGKNAAKAIGSGNYAFRMSLSRTGTNLRIAASVADESGAALFTQEVSDSLASTFVFNQVGFSFGPILAADGLTLTKVRVDTSAVVAAVPTGEPTNAAMAALQNQKKAAWDVEADEKRKAAMTPAELAREKALEANLGSFYLPIYKKDKAKGTVTAWDYVADVPGLPRILIIGDSISRGYTLPVRNALKGKANVHRAPENCGPSANGLRKLDIYLNGEKWDLITFNFSIHDRATPLDAYAKRIDEIATRLKATGAKVLWVSGTPLDKPADDEAQMIPHNTAAAELMAKHGIPIVDAWGFMKPRLAEFQRPNDVHYNDAGYEALAGLLAKAISERLGKP